MGILGQLTHNIAVDNCKVTPSHGRMLSTTADATHFVNCTGYIKLTNNLFENQKDDATNIHGIYAQVVKIISDTEVLIQLKHRQQHGFDFLQPGVTVEFVTGRSLITYSEATVRESIRLNKEEISNDVADFASSELNLREMTKRAAADGIIRKLQFQTIPSGTIAPGACS